MVGLRQGSIVAPIDVEDLMACLVQARWTISVQVLFASVLIKVILVQSCLVLLTISHHLVTVPVLLLLELRRDYTLLGLLIVHIIRGMILSVVLYWPVILILLGIYGWSISLIVHLLIHHWLLLVLVLV
jgi:hypothetical protein